MRKIVFLVLVIMSIFFCGLSTYFYFINLRLKNSLSELSHKKEEEIKAVLKKERELIRKDLDEKYRADMVSYEATVKRLELEKKRVRELQGQLKELQEKEAEK